MSPAGERGREALLAALDHTLHLWLAEPPHEPGRAWTAAAERLLSPDERARRARLLRAADRDRFLAARAFVRTTLSRYADVDPAAWTFRRGAQGRPEIAGPVAPRGLRMNLSHTPGLLALLVHDGADGGVDAERLGRVEDVAAMSRSALAAIERDQLLALPAGRRHERFLRLWTLKEAYVKATGRGMSTPLRDLWFERPDEEPIRLGCRRSVDPDPESWTFTLRRPTPDHVVATASRSGRAVEIFRSGLG